MDSQSYNVYIFSSFINLPDFWLSKLTQEHRGWHMQGRTSQQAQRSDEKKT